MTGENQNNIWQVEVGGTIYEAPLAELPEWIDEGSLQPEDKVRRGNLRWIQAAKVPALTPFFNARAGGERLPLVETCTDASPENVTSLPETQISEPAPAPPQDKISVAPGAVANHPRPGPGECAAHAGIAAQFICSACWGEFCRACTRSYGGSIYICPECGSMCGSKNDISTATQASTAAEQSLAEPFGLVDLKSALAHPFGFKPSLVFGGLMFLLFTLGQSVLAFGGMVFLVGALFCGLLANALTFGILANSVKNFMQGRTDADFMPSFDDFSLWGDVIHPFFLSIGVYLSSFGPFGLVAVIGVYLLTGAAGEESRKYHDELAKVPGTQYYAPDRTVEQSQEVKELLERVKQTNERRLAQQKQLTESEDSVGPPQTEEFGRSILSDPGAAETALPKAEPGAPSGGPVGPAVESENERFRIVNGMLRLAAPLVVLGTLALLWGLFYFPAACAVAGYSRSFISTINPVVGLDTIRRLGLNYFKLLMLGLLLAFVSAIAGFLVQMILSPLYLPAEHFDAVIFSAVLEHVYDPASVMAKVAGVIKPGGVLYCDVPNESGLYFRMGNLYQKLRGRDWCVNLAPTFSPFHVMGFSPKSFRNILERNGLRPVEFTVYGGSGLVPARGGVVGAFEALAAKAVTKISDLGEMGTYMRSWSQKESR